MSSNVAVWPGPLRVDARCCIEVSAWRFGTMKPCEQETTPGFHATASHCGPLCLSVLYIDAVGYLMFQSVVRMCDAHRNMMMRGVMS